MNNYESSIHNFDLSAPSMWLSMPARFLKPNSLEQDPSLGEPAEHVAKLNVCHLPCGCQNEQLGGTQVNWPLSPSQNYHCAGTFECKLHCIADMTKDIHAWSCYSERLYRLCDYMI